MALINWDYLANVWGSQEETREIELAITKDHYDTVPS